MVDKRWRGLVPVGGGGSAGAGMEEFYVLLFRFFVCACVLFLLCCGYCSGCVCLVCFVCLFFVGPVEFVRLGSVGLDCCTRFCALCYLPMYYRRL